jgi:hypothetical protein
MSVPEHLTDEQFWQRYLFHKHMIEAEDEKRKQLLQGEQPPHGVSLARSLARTAG